MAVSIDQKRVQALVEKWRAWRQRGAAASSEPIDAEAGCYLLFDGDPRRSLDRISTWWNYDRTPENTLGGRYLEVCRHLAACLVVEVPRRRA